MSSVGLVAAPQPPIWGGAETWYSLVNMTNPADSKVHPTWTFDYFFDAPNNRELYMHARGQGDEVCKKIAGAAENCNVLNVDGKGYISNVDTGECCHQTGWMIPDDWLSSCGATLNETITDINGEEVNVWQCDGQFRNNYADASDGTDQPIRFWEYKGDDLKQWDFVRDSYSTAKEMFDDS
eukprot:CAMPEP_0118651426 /NCGR_PEP_ID=MMETSP0785-20121206/10780_1 /TAXON_ID=91992 /ORGANISM="Bolidomonas pacifica, Strain CCMP 1866" /LENGTH=180 /DNA_ID=CAMNT_0006543879 /DNA_START=173 /DNA_END=712 /DNA_ORIENTATION=+